MSSTRLMYDTDAYRKELDESTGPLSYTLNPMKYNNCRQCRIKKGIVGGNNVSLYPGNLVDLESDLRGQFRPASRAPQKHYKPKCRKSNYQGSGLPCDGWYQPERMNHLPECQMFQYPEVPETKWNYQSCKYPEGKRH